MHEEALASAGLSSEELAATKSILEMGESVRTDLLRLKKSYDRITSDHDTQMLEQNYAFVRSFEAFCRAVSMAHGFKLTPYEFKIGNFELDCNEIDQFLDSAPTIFDRFTDYLVSKFSSKTSCFGISCIGQEQLIFSLLLGKKLKEQNKGLVVIGGTILSRILSRGLLPAHWFDQYFDIIVKNEGERSLEGILKQRKEHQTNWGMVDGIAFKDGHEIVSTAPALPLNPSEVPLPDFTDLPLERYFSSTVTLPLLSSRGCYWGKCEFCHHGMVYGEKYSGDTVDNVVSNITQLSTIHNVKHFAFNDEAIPPKILRGLGERLSHSSQTGFAFTGLIKFEKYFQPSDFQNAYDVGFRSLYVGLESASERVLALMKKNNSEKTMVSNLTDAAEAGIWMHCFVFFGFPGETEAEAQKTYDFILSNSNIIGTFGCGTFALEHGAPIMRHLRDFGVETTTHQKTSTIDVYYGYKPSSGIDARSASHWAKKLNQEGAKIAKYHASDWLPREHLLPILSTNSTSDFIQKGSLVRKCNGMPISLKFGDVVKTRRTDDGRVVAVNRLNMCASVFSGKSAQALEIISEVSPVIGTLDSCTEPILRSLSDGPGDVADMYASDRVV